MGIVEVNTTQKGRQVINTSAVERSCPECRGPVMRMWGWDLILHAPRGDQEAASVVETDVPISEVFAEWPGQQSFEKALKRTGISTVAEFVDRLHEWGQADVRLATKITESERKGHDGFSAVKVRENLKLVLKAKTIAAQVHEQELESRELRRREQMQREQSRWLDDMKQWKQAITALKVAAPGVVTQEVTLAADELIAACSDGFPDRSGFLDAVARWKNAGHLPPPGVLGVCAEHQQLVQPTHPECLVSEAGSLVIKQGGTVVAAFASGEWIGFRVLQG